MTLALAAFLVPAVWGSPMPSVGPVKPFRAPARVEWKTANGISVVLIEDHRFPMLTARLATRGGASACPAEDAGLVEAMAELLTDGTAKRTSKQIADAADEFGGALSAEADSDNVRLEGYCLSEHSERMLELMSDVVRAPSFPESEVALRKRNMQDELNLQRGESDFLASVAFYRKFYGAHPYAITAPTDASIARISRKAVVEAHRKIFTPVDSVLVLIGDVQPGAAKALVDKHLGAWTGPPSPPDAPAASAGDAPRRVYLFDRPQSSQVSLFLGNLAVREDNPAYFDLLVANQVLGGSFASRLVQEVRESKGYTYRIGSRLEHRLTSSVFRVRTPVRVEVLEPALELIFEHFQRMRTKQVSAEELSKAKNFLAGSFARGLETQEGLADAVLHAKLHRLPPDFYDTYVERIKAVKGGDVLRAANTFIRPSEMVVVAVGDAVKIRDVLSKFSSEDVIAVDQDGR